MINSAGITSLFSAKDNTAPASLIDYAVDRRPSSSSVNPPNRNGLEPKSQTRSTERASSTVKLSPEAQKIVADLQNRDREVRAHEAAHASAGGGLAGAPNFSYTTGPDGRRYAVSGDVQIDVSSTGSPEEDIARAATIRRAALAPASPSGQDRAVAASAAQMEIDARAALAAARSETASAAAAELEAARKAYSDRPELSGTVINIQA